MIKTLQAVALHDVYEEHRPDAPFTYCYLALICASELARSAQNERTS